MATGHNGRRGQRRVVLPGRGLAFVRTHRRRAAGRAVSEFLGKPSRIVARFVTLRLYTFESMLAYAFGDVRFTGTTRPIRAGQAGRMAGRNAAMQWRCGLAHARAPIRRLGATETHGTLPTLKI